VHKPYGLRKKNNEDTEITLRLREGEEFNKWKEGLGKDGHQDSPSFQGKGKQRTHSFFACEWEGGGKSSLKKNRRALWAAWDKNSTFSKGGKIVDGGGCYGGGRATT